MLRHVCKIFVFNNFVGDGKLTADWQMSILSVYAECNIKLLYSSTTCAKAVKITCAENSKSDWPTSICLVKMVFEIKKYLYSKINNVMTSKFNFQFDRLISKMFQQNWNIESYPHCAERRNAETVPTGPQPVQMILQNCHSHAMAKMSE